ncbi:MAG: hypothetical protein K5666_04845 [Bacilli bacterium]|nr:hypothetical protein [Bacilli bacterium]
MISKKKTTANGIIKRFVGNKNTVTILGILACIATLIIGYNWRVRIATNPVTVPYAKQTLASRTLITSDMVGKIKISSTYASAADNLILSEQDVVNKYVSYKTSIPKNSLFYKEQIIEAEEMPDYAFSNIPDGYTIFSLKVDKKSTFYNSVRAGDYIDLYILAKDQENEDRVIYSKFIESIRVLAVKDESGNNILKNGLANGEPTELLFAVEEYYYVLLMKSQFIDREVEIIPLLRNAQYTKEANQINISSANLVDFIEDRCIEL